MPLAPDDAADALLHALQESAAALAADPHSTPEPRFRQRARAQLLHAMATPAQRPFWLPSGRRLGGRPLAGLLAALALCALIAVPAFARPVVTDIVESATNTVDQLLGRQRHIRPAVPAPLPTPAAVGDTESTTTTANATLTVIPVAAVTAPPVAGAATVAPSATAGAAAVAPSATASERHSVAPERAATSAPTAARTAPGTAIANGDRDNGKAAATVGAAHSRAAVTADVPQQHSERGTPTARGGTANDENHGQAVSAVQHQRPAPSPSPTSVPASLPGHDGTGQSGRGGGQDAGATHSPAAAGGTHIDAGHTTSAAGGPHGHDGDGSQR